MEPMPLQSNRFVDDRNRATKIQVWRFHRPHMRAFHFAWISYFIAFFGWFSVSPFLATISSQNEWLNKRDIVLSNIIALSGTVLMRLAGGPLCTRYGPRRTQGTMLILCSMPVALLGASRSFAMFSLLRFFVGFLGSTFVVSQAWTSSMFSNYTVATVNTLVASWGQFGGLCTNAIMPQIFIYLHRKFGFSHAHAWRVSMLIPAAVLVLCSNSVLLFSDDNLQESESLSGNNGSRVKTQIPTLTKASRNWATWALTCLYGCSYGVNLILFGNLALYLRSSFSISVGRAGLCTGLFGLSGLLAMPVAGRLSDTFGRKWGTLGRFWLLCTAVLLEAVAVMLFAHMRTLPTTLWVLSLLFLFSFVAEGATIGVIPFVDPGATAHVTGLVGAGGSIGAIALSFLLKSKKGRAQGFFNIGVVVLVVSILMSTLASSILRKSNSKVR